MIRRTLFQAVPALVLTATFMPSLLRSTRAQSAPINVVTTFSILDDMVRRVGGDAVATRPLVPAGGDAHTFEPTPNDAATIADADVIFAIGIDFEPWLAGLVESTGTTAPVVAVSAEVELLVFDPQTGEEHAADTPEGDEANAAASPAATPVDDDHGHGEFDPHIWHDVSNAVIMVENIRDALIAADPTHTDRVNTDAAAYLTELTALDQWVRAQVNTLPADRRKLVTSHDALGYYAHRYGFTLVGTAFGSLSTESGDPAAATIAALVQAIEAERVPAIFAENVSNPALMEAVAAEAGVTLAPPLYTDALGEPGSGADTYIGLIIANTNVIVGALSNK